MITILRIAFAVIVYVATATAQTPSRVVAESEKLPPIALNGENYEITIHKLRLDPPLPGEDDVSSSAQQVEIRDSRGELIFERNVMSPAQIAYAREHQRFAGAVTLSVSELIGARGRAIWLSWELAPSAPSACYFNLFLGLRNGKLAEFAEPFCAELDLTLNNLRDHGLVLGAGDTLNIIEPTPNYRYYIPLAVNFATGELVPERQCQIQLSSGQKVCEFRILAEPEIRPHGEVRLFTSPDPGASLRLVSVSPSSKIEYLSVLAENPDLSSAVAGKRFLPTLKVSIDGLVGFVRAETDLEKLGLLSTE